MISFASTPPPPAVGTHCVRGWQHGSQSVHQTLVRNSYALALIICSSLTGFEVNEHLVSSAALETLARSSEGSPSRGTLGGPGRMRKGLRKYSRWMDPKCV